MALSLKSMLQVLKGGADTPKQEETYEVLAPGHTYESVTEKITSITLSNRFDPRWLLALLFTGSVAGLMLMGVSLVFAFGVGL
ncbi:MAG TPA: hypothetical protein VK689_18045, partial [Armatimonadota bacterium]|nr:hypothetical protein [Armatimonadota bacterium]